MVVGSCTARPDSQPAAGAFYLAGGYPTLGRDYDALARLYVRAARIRAPWKRGRNGDSVRPKSREETPNQGKEENTLSLHRNKRWRWDAAMR